MGACKSSYPGLTEDVLEELTSLTYLNKGEILYLMKKFHSIDPEKLEADYHHRFEKKVILNKFEVLKNNPFQDRLFRVFSSQYDDCFSFEDLVDLCSAMSAECPVEVKAEWAFRLFDLDEDNQITQKDIVKILDRLTWDPNNRTNFLTHGDKAKIAEIIAAHVIPTGNNKILIQPTFMEYKLKGLCIGILLILEEMKLDNSGSIGMSEFKIIMTRLPEFKSSFYFRL